MSALDADIPYGEEVLFNFSRRRNKLFFDFFLVFACFLGQMSTLDADIPYGEEVLLINFKSKEP